MGGGGGADSAAAATCTRAGGLTIGTNAGPFEGLGPVPTAAVDTWAAGGGLDAGAGDLGATPLTAQASTRGDIVARFTAWLRVIRIIRWRIAIAWRNRQTLRPEGDLGSSACASRR
jgi:hypothetical protein